MKSHIESFMRVYNVTLQFGKIDVAKGNAGAMKVIRHFVGPPRNMPELDNTVGVIWHIVDDPLQVLFRVLKCRGHLEEKTRELRTEPANNEILEPLNGIGVCQSLHMCNEATHFYGESKKGRSNDRVLLEICKLRHAIERAVQFKCIKNGAVMFEPLA